MKPIQKQNTKMKHLIGIIEEPTYEDLLFEIVQFLDNTKRYDGEFKIREVSLYTQIRIEKDLNADIAKLEKLGYIKKIKYTLYKVLKHNWE